MALRSSKKVAWAVQCLGEQLLALAQRVQDRTFLLEAHRALGTTLLFLGELAPARAHLEEGAILYDLYDFSMIIVH
jgi:hypothetical protein